MVERVVSACALWYASAVLSCGTVECPCGKHVCRVSCDDPAVGTGEA